MPTSISGVVPALAVKASHHPARTETGIGALMPWADRLWMVTYVASKAGSGDHTGLFTVSDDLRLARHPASVVGTYANRMIHHETDTLLVGPHAIDTDGKVRTFDDLVDIRLTATCRHLHDPANKVYVLGMEGRLVELDVRSGKVADVADVNAELGVTGVPHYKDAFCRQGRLIVANNSYYPADYVNPDACDGRLAEWDGEEWTVLRRTMFNTVGGHVKGTLSPAVFAVGQDRASQILMVRHEDAGWSTYRLPKATHTQDHAWTTEWPRIREVESERFLMDAGGMFYELPAMTYAGRVRGLRPICTHLRIVGDFCSWNGMLVLAGDQTTPINDQNPCAGQPQANLWLGKTDDLWSFGGPAGWGGVWLDEDVAAGAISDPFLMTGFERKCLHLAQTDGEEARLALEVDFVGHGDWREYESFRVRPDGYVHHEFPAGFGAHWARVRAETACRATAWFTYT